MRPELWQEVLEIWPQVCARPAEERQTYLRQVCGDRQDLLQELETLLESDSEAGAFLEKPVLGGTPSADANERSSEPVEDRIGQRLGAFELRQLIGQGGMGTVYLGRRIDGELEQEVAVKVIRGTLKGTALEERFRVERQILARLEHPNIARLLDAGTAPDGSPYEVMEYVRGVPVTAYCERERLAVAAQVELMAKVCSAVETAHAQSIVHRDLKPANILVTDEGVPKLLDFGIAKLLDTPPEGGAPTVAPMMTPSYASPEQLGERPVTPASDVYSLGVLLYRLTTGELPYDWRSKNPVAIEREMQKGSPRRPSLLLGDRESTGKPAEKRDLAGRKALRGDLDNVILKALEAEPENRYSNAAELRRDLLRYLEQRPVLARPSGWSHRLGKLVSRNRMAASVVAILALALAALGLTAWRQAEQKADQEIAADSLRKQADDMVQFLENTYRDADPHLSSETLEEMHSSLQEHTERVLVDMQGQPGLQGRLLGTLGVIHRKLGELDRAGELLEQSHRLRLQHFGPDHSEVAAALGDQAALLRELGSFEEAEAKLQEALRIQRQADPRDPERLASTLDMLGEIKEGQGDFAASEGWLREALEIRRESGDRESIAVTLHNLAMTLVSDLGRLDEAEAASIESLQLIEGEFGNDSLRFAEVQLSLAEISSSKHDPRRAMTLYQDSLAIMREKLGGRHANVAIVLNNLGNVLRDLGLHGESEAAYVEALGIYREVFGNEHHEVAITLSNLAFLLNKLGQLERVVSVYEESVAIFRIVLGREHPTTAGVTSMLALARRTLGQAEAAEAMALESLRVMEQQLGEDHPWLYRTLCVLGKARQDQGDFGGAEEHLDRAYKIRSANNKDSPWDNAAVLGQLADLYRASGDLERTEAAYGNIREILKTQPEHWDGRSSHSLNLRLADLYLNTGRVELARPLLRPSVEALRELLPEGHYILASYANIEAAGQVAFGDVEGGLPRLEASLAELVRRLGPRAPLSLEARDRLHRAQDRLGLPRTGQRIEDKDFALSDLLVAKGKPADG